MGPGVFGYIRVSQAEGASGLATQSRILTDHGLRGDRIYSDVASGRTMRRPAWTTLRETLQPGDVVVVPRLDRLARNLSEGLRTIEELHAQGIHIRSLAEGLDTGDDSPTARLMLHMLLSLAEWERETIRDRIRAGVDRAAAEGRTGGRPPALDSEKLRAVRDFLENGRLGQRGRPGVPGESGPTVPGRQGRDLLRVRRAVMVSARPGVPGCRPTVRKMPLKGYRRQNPADWSPGVIDRILEDDLPRKK